MGDAECIDAYWRELTHHGRARDIGAHAEAGEDRRALPLRVRNLVVSARLDDFVDVTFLAERLGARCAPRAGAAAAAALTRARAAAATW